MFTKFEMLGAITISLIGGMAIGYSKAREICLQAIIQATGEQKKTEATENEEEPWTRAFSFRRISKCLYEERSSSNESWENVPAPEMVSYKN